MFSKGLQRGTSSSHLWSVRIPLLNSGLIGIIFHPSDPLFSLIIFLYVSVIFLYMFFAFCWYDGMPIATFSSYPERGAKARKKRTYARFVYPFPDKLESLKDKNAPSEDKVCWYFKYINIWTPVGICQQSYWNMSVSRINWEKSSVKQNNI